MLMRVVNQQIQKKEKKGVVSSVKGYLGDIVDTLLESVHDHFFQDGHRLLVGRDGRG